jgi:RsiW-degrading membrane proteinase PrsW (M82 family)
MLYYVLTTYEDYIEDSNIYGFFAGGMIMGMVFFVAHTLVDYQVINLLDLAILIFIFLFAVVEELAKYVVLYYKKFLGEYKTTYTGLSMGLGFGATAIIALIYWAYAHQPGLFEDQLLTWPSALVLSLGFIGMHATTGGLIGYGSAKKVRWNYLGIALVLHLVFNTIYLIFWWTPYPAKFGIAIILAAIGLGGIFYFRQEVMPTSLPRKQARERKRKLRRQKLGWDKRQEMKDRKKEAKEREPKDASEE